jgi:CheY-like chemotaxis protein
MSQPTSPARILVVDDEDEVRLSLRRMLESAGYEVLEASDGQEAMKVCRSRPLDLVITDIFMPGQEGMETIQALRREFPSVKIIAITGKASEVYLKTARLLGAQATLQKPLRLDPLLEAVRAVLGTPSG